MRPSRVAKGDRQPRIGNRVWHCCVLAGNRRENRPKTHVRSGLAQTETAEPLRQYVHDAPGIRFQFAIDDKIMLYYPACGVGSF